jgi:hypothetical protein
MRDSIGNKIDCWRKYLWQMCEINWPGDQDVADDAVSTIRIFYLLIYRQHFLQQQVASSVYNGKNAIAGIYTLSTASLFAALRMNATQQNALQNVAFLLFIVMLRAKCLSVVAGNPYRKGWLSTIDLLVKNF